MIRIDLRFSAINCKLDILCGRKLSFRLAAARCSIIGHCHAPAGMVHLIWVGWCRAADRVAYGGVVPAFLMQVASVTENYVLYDGACPACSRYIAASGLAGNRDIALINARTNRALVAEHANAGRLIDDGMVVVIDGVIHYGADATRKISEIGRPAGPAQRILLWIVGKAPWANALYPALAVGRRGLLRLLGRSLIGP